MDNALPPLSYAPDGLYEADVDALIAEYFTVDEPRTDDHVSTHRHVRRLNRQTVSAALRVRIVERADESAA